MARSSPITYDGGTGTEIDGGSEELCTAIGLVNPGGDCVVPSDLCLCTRRDTVPVGMCPRGVGQSASATIDASGGTISLQGQQGLASGVSFSITFPPTAISSATLITVTETSLPPPAGMADYSPIYQVEPTGLVLNTAAQVVVPFSQGRGSYCDTPTLFWSATSLCDLERLPSGYANAGFMQGNIGRLGYAITGFYSDGDTPYCQ